MPDPLKLELQSFVSLQEDSGKQTRVHSSPRGRTLECAEEAESCPTDYLQEAENFSTGMLSIKEQARRGHGDNHVSPLGPVEASSM